MPSLAKVLWQHVQARVEVGLLGLGYARQLGDPERAALLEVELLDHVSTALDLAGEPERAESSSRQALATLLALDGPHVVQEARVRANLAVVLSNLDRNAESQGEIEDALSQLEAVCYERALVSLNAGRLEDSCSTTRSRSSDSCECRSRPWAIVQTRKICTIERPEPA
ncbi:hypothetical protein [Enhygromyxa salina]|uniref:Tetratricopeptide repeat protein n=1 Tax=Enhygromyxa salina TaxID=215803 RepID=A0A2S9XPI8_9BACT|nr:hypothetical protein [Enhygromyxa salina]PRP94778.1 hypothetical protein ENSA7_76010 [Enhygromyxa salina]